MGLSKEEYKIARLNGISRQTAFHRVKDLNWSNEKAITDPVQKHERTGLTSEDYKRAKANGIPRQTVYSRYEIQFWDKEKAITEPIGEKMNWEKWGPIAEKLDIGYATFWKRTKKMGMTPLAAATTPKQESKSRGRKMNG